MFSKDWHRRPVEKFLLTRVDFARILLDFGGLLTEICQLLTGFSPPCGEVSRGHALVSPLFEVSYVMSSAFFAIRQKTLGKKANKGFALNPLRSRRIFEIRRGCWVSGILRQRNTGFFGWWLFL